MKCPKCQERLRIEIYRNNEYKICFYCEGAWVQKSDLDTHSLLELSLGEKAKTELHCPSCVSEYLWHANVAGIEVDFCKNCEGIFFDKGELEHVSPDYKSIDSGGAAKDSAKAAITLYLFARSVGKVFSLFSR